MPGPVLYSTKVFLKLYIQEKYRKDLHYVWCSENFDSKMLSRYSGGALVPASSNPADIYRELRRDVNSKDKHSGKINAQKTSLKKLAVDWHARGEISLAERDDITYIVDSASFDDWRPIIYVIPRAQVASRLKLVPAQLRAGIGDEFTIEDLQRSEFDIIEL